MTRYGTYFKWAGGLAVAYAAVLLLSWALLAGDLGAGIYAAGTPTASRLFDIYASGAAAAALYAEVVGWFLLAAALPAFAIYLGRRSPGLAWGGLAVAAPAMILSLAGYLMEAVAYRVAAGAPGDHLFASVVPGDVILLFGALGEALTTPATFVLYAWFVMWGLAFARAAGGPLARAAAAAMFAYVGVSALTLAAFAARWSAGANVGFFLQTLAEAAAFALAGASLLVHKGD